MRGKITDLEEAFTGRFSDHHAFLLAKMLARIDAISADIADVDARIEAEIAPFAEAVARLDEIPGVGHTAARVIIAEVGVDMTRFPTAAHLCVVGPVRARDQGIRRPQEGQRGHRARQPLPGPGARRGRRRAGKTDTFLGERYRRIARRRGKKKAIVAVGRSILVIVWHLLADPETRFHDLGPDFYDTRVNTNHQEAQPHPPTRGPRLQRHPRTRRLTAACWCIFDLGDRSGICPLTVIFGLGVAMPEKRTKYDREFREGAVRIVKETGKPIAQIARDLGVNEGTLGNWVARDREKRQSTDGLSTGDVEELKRLRAEVAELRMERDVLIGPVRERVRAVAR